MLRNTSEVTNPLPSPASGVPNTSKLVLPLRSVYVWNHKGTGPSTTKIGRHVRYSRQHVEVHIFTEKDAITGVVEPVAEQWNVPLGVLRGYSSETFAHNMAQAIMASGKDTFVYQLGDHDPSGVGAWQDFQRKVAGFMPLATVNFDESFYPDDYDEPANWGGQTVTFERIAVLEEQIIWSNLPTRPTKRTDTRSNGWVGGSVEVDAIPAPVLRRIVSDAIEQHIDPRLLKQTELVERSERRLLFDLAGSKWSK